MKRILNVNVNLGDYMPLWEGVYQILREAIVEGDLLPGEHLAEQQLAEGWVWPDSGTWPPEVGSGGL